MKIIKRILKAILITALSLIILISVGDAAWIFIPQIQAQKDIDKLNDIAHSITDISVPADATVIAVGEASHGNKEFQELKLSVLQQLVEKQAVSAFVLEADFGECMIINDYIHDNSNITSAEEAVKKLSFNIYHTQQMIDLIQWMFDYNQEAENDEKLSFYGFDLQNPRTGIQRIIDFCEENNILST